MKDKLSQEVLEHWAENKAKARAGELKLRDIRGGKCAYCKVYSSGLPMSKRCGGCPVNKEVNEKGCFGTPWHSVKGAIEFSQFKNTVTTKTDDMYYWLENMMKRQGLI